MNTHDRFKKAREDNAAEAAADYVELIQDLIDEFGEARATDLATRMGVSHVTVSKSLQRLVKNGLVTYRPYRSIFLTEEGRKLAVEAHERHVTVLQFLRALGVSEPVAEQDAEGMEHHLSPETMAAFRNYVAGKQPRGASLKNLTQE
jgi:DtxR family manganese transport transcriptional regulator